MKGLNGCNDSTNNVTERVKYRMILSQDRLVTNGGAPEPQTTAAPHTPESRHHKASVDTRVTSLKTPAQGTCRPTSTGHGATDKFSLERDEIEARLRPLKGAIKSRVMWPMPSIKPLTIGEAGSGPTGYDASCSRI